MDSRVRFEALYQAHCGTVRAFARRRVSAAVADDVVADVFLIAWRRLDETPDDEVDWLLGIARGVLANLRRGEARRVALRERLVNCDRPGVSDGLAAPSDDSTVQRALQSLPARDQELLLLVAWDGLDREQAAKVLGVGVGAFAVRLHRARRRLAKALDAEDGTRRRTAERPSSLEAF